MAERALATAYVNIVPGTQAVERYLKGGLGGSAAKAGDVAGNKFSRSFGSHVKGIAAGFGAAFGAVAVTNFFKDAVKGASDLSEQTSAVQQIFGKGSSAIAKFADGSATKLGQTKTQVMEAAKSFGVFGKAAGLTGKDNAKFSTGLVQLATDLASFNNTSVDEALVSLQAGLRGESEPLRRYGVLLDDAQLRQQALALGLVKTTKQALTPQQRVLAAQALIYKQTSAQQGDFERTSGGLANQQRILTASWENAQATLGESLLPTITDLVTSLNTTVIPAVQQFFTDFKNGKTPLNDIINALTGVYNWVKDNAEWLGILATAVGSAVLVWKLWTGAITLWRTVTTTATAIQIGFNAALNANPIGVIVTLVAALVGALIYFFTQTKIGKKIWSGFTAFLTSSMKTLGGFFSSVWNGIKTAFTTVFDGIGSAFKGYVNFWAGLINHIIDGLNTIKFDIPSWVPIIGGQRWGINLPHVPMLANGGLVNTPTTAIIGEAGPEVVTPLKDFERMMGLTEGKSSSRPIYADGIGLIGMVRETAKGQARLVFNAELGKALRGTR